MKWNLSLVALLAALFVFNSCTEDVNTLADYKDVALIWSFLDKSDTAHYVVVQKGFVNPNQNANQIAQNPDSIYFDNIDVIVEEIKNGSVSKTWTLTKVDLAAEGIAKDTGVFANNKNYAYRWYGNLSTTATYRITVTHGNNKFVASTPILPVDPSTLNIGGLSWTDSSKSLNFTPTRSQNLYWATGAGAVYDALIRIKYFDIFDNNPNDTITHYIDWKFMSNRKNEGQTNLSVFPNYNELLNVLVEKIPPATAGQKRYIGNWKLMFYAGSQRLLNYVELQAAKGGISAGQVTPEFTEGFETEYTYGLFDTRGSAIYPDLQVNDSTVYYLRFDPVLKDINFKGKIRK